MNKRLGTLAAVVALSAVAAISSGVTQPLPWPRPCTITGSFSKPCIQPRRMPPVPAAQPPRATHNTTSAS
jgi:hypothetical protein